MNKQGEDPNRGFISDTWKKLKTYIENQLRLKKIIRRAQLLQFSTGIRQQSVGLSYSYIACGILILNATVLGLWRFSHKQYRNMKNVLTFQVLYGYLLGSYFLVWQDYLFLNNICDSKNDLAYYYRKQCIQKVGQMKKVNQFKVKFEKLNSQYKRYNSIIINNQKINFVGQI